MRMNGLNVVLLVVCNLALSCTASQIHNIVPEQTSISSGNEGVEADNTGNLYNGLRSEKHELFNSKLQARSIVENAIKRDESHNIKPLVEQHKWSPIERKKRKQIIKRKHHTETRKDSHKKRTRKWDDIIVKSKKGHNLKHSHKLLSKGKDNLKKDNTLHGSYVDKISKQASDKSVKGKDNGKNRDEQTVSTSNKNFHGRVNGKRKSKTTKSKTSDKSDQGKGHHKHSDEQTASTSNKNSHHRINDKSKDKTTKSKDSDKPDKGNDHQNSNEESISKFLNETELVSLRDALLVHPFSIWKFKDRFNSMADLGIHEALLHDVVENKWNTRLKHKLFKVFRGENIHLAVIGGSNTAGGGIQQDEGRTDGLFFRVILDWWQKTITPITGSHLKTRQIAMGGTGSDFFQYCYQSYIQKDVDLVLLEMSVNDLHELPYRVNLSLPIEQLTRQLLDYPTEPALLYVNLLSGRSYYQGCTNLEDFGQRLLSDTYEVTTLSWRDAVCPVIDGKFRIPIKGCSVVCKDGHHINQLGHAHISLMIINLFRDLLLDSIGHVDELSLQVFHDEVVLPKPVFIAEESKIITNPVCWTTVTPNFKKKIIENSMEVGVMENYGFDYVHDKAIGGGQCFTEDACRADAYSGWTGQDVGASLTLSFTVPPLGHKRSIQSRSVVFATRTCWKCGVAEVWLDDDVVNRRQVRSQSQYSQTLLEIVALRVNPGDHTMSVKVVHPGFVTVVGVMLGPPDGPY